MSLPLVVAIDLPLHTVSEANSRSHHHERARRVKVQRHGVQMALAVPLRRSGFIRSQGELELSSGATIPLGGPTTLVAPLVVRLTRLASRQLDDDNLRGALKAIRDGIADALGLKSDRDPRVEWRYAQARAPKEMPHGVRVEIWQRVLEEERQRAGTDG